MTAVVARGRRWVPRPRRRAGQLHRAERPRPGGDRPRRAHPLVPAAAGGRAGHRRPARPAPARPRTPLVNSRWCPGTQLPAEDRASGDRLPAVAAGTAGGRRLHAGRAAGRPPHAAGFERVGTSGPGSCRRPAALDPALRRRTDRRRRRLAGARRRRRRADGPRPEFRASHEPLGGERWRRTGHLPRLAGQDEHRCCGRWRAGPSPRPGTGWWKDTAGNAGRSPTSSSGGPTAATAGSPSISP